MDSDKSIVLLEQVIAKEPSLPLYTKLGEWLMRKQDYQKAVPVFREAVQRDPDSSPTRFYLAKCLMALQDYAAAIPELEKIIEKVPNQLQAHSYLQLAYARTNRLSEAIRECKTILQYDPDDYGSYLILGQSLARSGNSEEGIAALKKAASLQPTFPLRTSGWLKFTISWDRRRMRLENGLQRNDWKHARQTEHRSKDAREPRNRFRTGTELSGAGAFGQ